MIPIICRSLLKKKVILFLFWFWNPPSVNIENFLGMIYIYYSEPIDYNKAGQWFSLAAEKGDKDAEEVLRNNLRYNRFTKKWDAVR